MRKSNQMALGGMLAALAVVIMAMGGLIPVATYVCPMLCALLLAYVCRFCGNRVGWAWYGAVMILSLLLCPDKEAAAVFVAFGYYPIIKPKIDKSALRWLWKAILFNTVSILLYLLLIYVFGMIYILTEFQELGIAGLVITLLLGNVCFFLLDRVLNMIRFRMKK